MKKNRIIGAFTAIAIISAALVSFLVYHYLNPARGIIYVFNDDYSTGQQVTKDMLTPVQVDMAIISGGAKGRIEDQFVTAGGYESIVTSGDTLKMDVAEGMPLKPNIVMELDMGIRAFDFAKKVKETGAFLAV